MKKFLLGLLAAPLFFGCATDHTTQPDRIFGPSVPIGNGSAKSWVSLDAQSNPTAIGFTLSKGALDNLPGTLPETAYMLALPNEATAKTPYQHIMINWNPGGHEPAGIYNVPHFDFHFYIQPMHETMAIPPYTPASAAKFDKLPPAGSIHSDFAKGPGGVPGMGAHWSDVTSPEFKGVPFTETFVFGSYDGQVTFWEQMITMAYLKTNPNLDKAIKQPTVFVPGYYPQRYGIKSNADGSIDILMNQMIKR